MFIVIYYITAMCCSLKIPTYIYLLIILTQSQISTQYACVAFLVRLMGLFLILVTTINL